jgi:hypothetical protein
MLPPGFVCAGSVAILQENSTINNCSRYARCTQIMQQTDEMVTAEHLTGRSQCHTPVLDLSRHGHECLLDIRGALGRGFQEWDANLVCKGLRQ